MCRTSASHPRTHVLLPICLKHDSCTARESHLGIDQRNPAPREKLTYTSTNETLLLQTSPTTSIDLTEMVLPTLALAVAATATTITSGAVSIIETTSSPSQTRSYTSQSYSFDPTTAVETPAPYPFPNITLSPSPLASGSISAGWASGLTTPTTLLTVAAPASASAGFGPSPLGPSSLPLQGAEPYTAVTRNIVEASSYPAASICSDSERGRRICSSEGRYVGYCDMNGHVQWIPVGEGTACACNRGICGVKNI